MGMAASSINGLWLIFNPWSTEGSTLSLKKIGPGVSQELFKGVIGWQTDDGQQVIPTAHPKPKSFKGVDRCMMTDEQMDEDGWHVITIAHPEPSAQGLKWAKNSTDKIISHELTYLHSLFHKLPTCI